MKLDLSYGPKDLEALTAVEERATRDGIPDDRMGRDTFAFMVGRLASHAGRAGVERYVSGLLDFLARPENKIEVKGGPTKWDTPGRHREGAGERAVAELLGMRPTDCPDSSTGHHVESAQPGGPCAICGLSAGTAHTSPTERA